MIRLEKHDEIVEAIARQLYIRACGGMFPSYTEDGRWDVAKRDAAAALDALLDAAVRLKVGRPAISSATKDTWYAETCFPGSKATDGDFPALILRMEASDDNA